MRGCRAIRLIQLAQRRAVTAGLRRRDRHRPARDDDSVDLSVAVESIELCAADIGGRVADRHRRGRCAVRLIQLGQSRRIAGQLADRDHNLIRRAVADDDLADVSVEVQSIERAGNVRRRAADCHGRRRRTVRLIKLTKSRRVSRRLRRSDRHCAARNDDLTDVRVAVQRIESA